MNIYKFKVMLDDEMMWTKEAHYLHVKSESDVSPNREELLGAIENLKNEDLYDSGWKNHCDDLRDAVLNCRYFPVLGYKSMMFSAPGIEMSVERVKLLELK
jgi:hypothetical protein